MATRKQIRANRENARRSTGPRTPAGKSALKMPGEVAVRPPAEGRVERSETSGSTAASPVPNNSKHGLTSRRFLIRDDEREEFQQLREGLIADYDPRGAHAWLVFEQALLAAWNLKRVARVEAELFENDTDPLANPDLHSQLQLLMRYHARHERAFYRALSELRAAKVATPAGFTNAGVTHTGATNYPTPPADHPASRASVTDPPDLSDPGANLETPDIFEQLLRLDELGAMVTNQHQPDERRSNWIDKLRL